MGPGNIHSIGEDINHIGYYYQVSQSPVDAYSNLTQLENSGDFWIGVLQRMNYDHAIIGVLFKIFDRLNNDQLLWASNNIERLSSYLERYPRFIALVLTEEEEKYIEDLKKIRKYDENFKEIKRSEAKLKEFDEYMANLEEVREPYKEFKKLEEFMKKLIEECEENGREIRMISREYFIERSIKQWKSRDCCEKKVKDKIEKQLRLARALIPEEFQDFSFSTIQSWLKDIYQEADSKITEGIALRENLLSDELIGHDKLGAGIIALQNFEAETKSKISRIVPMILAALKSILNIDIVNRRDSRGRYPLHSAAENGDLDLVKLLISLGSDLEVMDDENNTPLHLAIRNRHVILVPFLLPDQVYTPIGNANGCTPLELSIDEGLEEIVYMLYKRRKNYEEEESLVYFLMYSLYEVEAESLNRIILIAARKNLINVLRQALEKGGDVNSRDNKGAALHWASKRGHIRIVNLLLEERASLEMDDLNRTALHVAALEGHLEVVRLLLSQHIDIINYLDFENNTALCLAIIGGQFEVVKLLLENSADISNQNIYGKTPYALLLGLETRLSDYSEYEFIEQLEILKILLNACPQMDVADARGLTAMDRAILIGSQQLIELLLKRGANLNIEVLLDFLLSEGVNPSEIPGLKLTFIYISQRDNIDKESVLVLRLFLKPSTLEINEVNEIILITAKQNLKKILEKALSLGGSINAKDHNGLTALHWAAYNGYDEVVDFLLEQGAEIEPVDYKGRTPLHLAAKRASLATVQLLVSRGAQPDTRDNNCRTVFDFAMRNQNEDAQEIMDFLGDVEGAEREDEAAFL